MLKIDDNAPDFTLKNTNKEDVSLSDFSDKTVVLAFYPGAYTGVCDSPTCEMIRKTNRIYIRKAHRKVNLTHCRDTYRGFYTESYIERGCRTGTKNTGSASERPRVRPREWIIDHVPYRRLLFC